MNYGEGSSRARRRFSFMWNVQSSTHHNSGFPKPTSAAPVPLLKGKMEFQVSCPENSPTCIGFSIFFLFLLSSPFSHPVRWNLPVPVVLTGNVFENIIKNFWRYESIQSWQETKAQFQQTQLDRSLNWSTRYVSVTPKVLPALNHLP